MQLYSTTLSNGSAQDIGASGLDDDGGGIFNDGTLTVTNSTLSGNSAGWGGGIANVSSGTVTVKDSTLSGNSASEDGGGGIANINGTVTVKNSTLSDNSASEDGGGWYL